MAGWEAIAKVLGFPGGPASSWRPLLRQLAYEPLEPLRALLAYASGVASFWFYARLVCGLAPVSGGAGECGIRIPDPDRDIFLKNETFQLRGVKKSWLAGWLAGQLDYRASRIYFVKGEKKARAEKVRD